MSSFNWDFYCASFSSISLNKGVKRRENFHSRITPTKYPKLEHKNKEPKVCLMHGTIDICTIYDCSGIYTQKSYLAINEACQNANYII